MSLSSRIFIKNCTASDTARDKDLKIPEGINVFRDIPYDTKGHLLDISIPRDVFNTMMWMCENDINEHHAG